MPLFSHAGMAKWLTRSAATRVLRGFESLSSLQIKIFKEKLNAEIIIRNNQGHFNEVSEIKEVLEFILK